MNGKTDIVDVENLSEGEIRLAVKRIIETHAGRGAITVINAGYNAGLDEYIKKHTAFLDEFEWVNFSTRCYAFANEIASEAQLPHCAACGKLISSNVVSVHVGFKYETCSRKCAANSESRNAKRRTTMLETYGDENWNNREKYRRTCLDRFGVECNFQDAGSIEKSKKTKLEKHGDENWNNREKAAETCMELYGMGNNGEAISEGKARKLEENPNYYAEIDEKGKKTRLEKHGDENWNNRPMADATKIEKYRTPGYNNREKAAATCSDRYGVDNPAKLDSSKAAARETCMDKYGVDNPSKLKETVEKAAATSVGKFGETHYAKTEYARLKTSIRKSSELFNAITTSETNKAKPLFSFGEFRSRSDDTMLKWKCAECGKEFDAPANFIYARQTGTYARCPHCHPVPESGSFEQKLVEDYVRSTYCGEITTNNRRIISPLEIDIFLPDAKIGIEFNGLYWHSAIWRSDLRHMARKSSACSEKGILLFQVMEDEWKNFRKQTEWRIAQALGVRGEQPGGKLSVTEITDKSFELFMSEHSNDVYAKRGKTKIGVFAGQDLVLVASLTVYRENAVLYTVQGACRTNCSDAMRALAEYARAKYKGLTVLAKVDNRYPYDKHLFDAGFRFDRITAPIKWIINTRKWKRLPRKSYGKILQAVKKSGKLEIDYLHSSGMTVVYDCGQRIYRLAE